MYICYLSEKCKVSHNDGIKTLKLYTVHIILSIIQYAVYSLLEHGMISIILGENEI